MGCGGSTAQQGTQATKETNKKIQEKMIKQKETAKEIIKVLLLGAGECGKSTILKQMKIINLEGGFTDEEVLEGTKLVWKNTMDSIQALCAAVKDFGLAWADPANADKAAKIMAVDTSMDIPINDLRDDIKLCWADDACQAAKKRDNEFHLLDSAKYFLNDVEKFFQDDFRASPQDMLRTRLTTTGIIETQFPMESQICKIYDVGGQRGERKKWIHCFDDVTAIMYIASLSEYDQVLAEDRTKNRLEESLTLFEGIANLPWFEKASIILFLNKKDLFEEKVLRVDIGDFHPEYTGGKDYDAGLNWIKGEYMDRNEDDDKQIYPHATDATDTENVKFVWGAVQHTILKSKLSSSGLQM